MLKFDLQGSVLGISLEIRPSVIFLEMKFVIWRMNRWWFDVANPKVVMMNEGWRLCPWVHLLCLWVHFMHDKAGRC